MCDECDKKYQKWVKRFLMGAPYFMLPVLSFSCIGLVSVLLRCCFGLVSVLSRFCFGFVSVCSFGDSIFFALYASEFVP